MKKRELKLYKDVVKRKKFLKNEIKIIILKSVLQNFQINEIIRSGVLKQICFLKKKSYISKQNNVCLLTGRFGGVYKLYDVSRHSMKILGKFNMLHNIKIKSW